ncbi:hypothetical protein ABZ671_32660 [Micromonospora sp. NPDC006766]|uniref:hypothetical protein n=1 Tax=Micromonospora sp. NPDC006766 TaxID=3154778 RepID=UPI0033F40D9D
MVAIGGDPEQGNTHQLNASPENTGQRRPDAASAAREGEPATADTMTPEELREHGLRPSPVAEVEDPHKRVWPDRGTLESDMREAADRMAEAASYQYATMSAGAAAQLIREAFGEKAHRAVFERGEMAGDAGTYANLLVVYDADDDVLWYDRQRIELSVTPFGRSADEIEAWGGHIIPQLAETTRTAIERLIVMAEDTNGDGYLVETGLETGTFTDNGKAEDGDFQTGGDVLLELEVQEEIDDLHTVGGHPASDGSQFPQRRLLSPLERDITVRVLNDVLLAGEQTKVRLFPGDRGTLANVAATLDPRHNDDGERDRIHSGYISLDRLEMVLRRETSVIDPDDVANLMKTIRMVTTSPSAGGDHPDSPAASAQPGPDEATAQRLVQLAEDLDIADDALDSLVHDMHSLPASQVNNGGFEDQVRYLLPLMSEAELEQAIRSAA